ncbi:MAG: hypothetical protein DMG59_24495 [Acidobacteria bacterium]|nr:MAG: hypothetical protein DMG59_24495 [Acidobacteriota bacterium]
MNSVLQAKLLHVLQDGKYTRLGGTRTLHSKARILASTNKPLQNLVAGGSFREDLYFRLNVITIEIPPLRERPEDIVPLCHCFVEKYRAKYNSCVKRLPAQMEEAFSRHSWPGNIRQLENAVRRFLILADLESAPWLKDNYPQSQTATTENLSLKEASAMAAEQVEKEVILRTLEEVHWNRQQAARRLNICYRSFLNRLRKWQRGEDFRRRLSTNEKRPFSEDRVSAMRA